MDVLQGPARLKPCRRQHSKIIDIASIAERVLYAEHGRPVNVAF
jgi:hypothetical protein